MKSTEGKWTGKFRFITPGGLRAIIKSSKGTDDDLSKAVRFTNLCTGQHLDQLDLITQFDTGYYEGADIKISVKGSGTVDVGLVFAQEGVKPAINLGRVEIEGDLGRILVGTGSASVPALAMLKVNSLGRQLGPNPELSASLVTGGMHKLTVRHDIQNAVFEVFGDLKEVKIGGSIIGGPVDRSGSIICSGGIGDVSIDGNVIGGDGNSSGSIFAKGDIGKIKVGGTRQPGNGADTGVIKSHA